jgi:sulfopyruvate decarboxylase TPP-binding subunit
MLDGPGFVATLRDLGTTHLVWIPDSTLGTFEPALGAAPELQVVRPCREGEAWAIAAGLLLGGARPFVAMQCTGLFESGDALRNVVHDLGLPIQALVGYRSYLDQAAMPGDTCLTFTEPVLTAWQLATLFVCDDATAATMAEHHRACVAAGRAGVTLLAEGRA